MAFLSYNYQHEHWDEFDLIDMSLSSKRGQCKLACKLPSGRKAGIANGRMYDPTVGRFLSPDPYVQDATNPQNYNRYAYCLNNPLKYTDPSGYECEERPSGEKDLAIKEDDEYWSLA